MASKKTRSESKRAKAALLVASFALAAASCGGAETIESQASGAVGDDQTTVDQEQQQDSESTGGSVDEPAIDQPATDEPATDEPATDEPEQAAPAANTTLLVDPQTSTQLHDVLREMQAGSAQASANKLTYFPEIPIPEGASFFGYETDATGSLFDGVLGTTRFEYFFDKPIAEVADSFVADMEAAGWEVEQAEQSGTSILTVTVPNQQFPLEISIYGEQYRGATLAILNFSVNGAAEDQNGHLSIWSGLADELGILMPEGSTPSGGGAISYREPTGSEEAIDPAGDFLLITNGFAEPGDVLEKTEAFADYAETQGFETVVNGSEVSLVKDKVATTYKFNPQKVTVQVELAS